MRAIKPQRISLLQRAFEVRNERHFAIGLTAYTPFEAPELPLPEISMWKEVAAQAGKDVAIDEGLPKPRGEVLLFGKAFAPGGSARPAFQARLALGPVQKTVFVVGKRSWVRGVPSDPEPLTELYLSWDKAFGGPTFAANPIGIGAAPASEEGRPIHRLPQLEDPKHLLTSPNQRPAPAAFGPLDATWPERQSKLGTYDAKWLESDFPGFASDLDPEYFMIAPVDQRLPAFFRGGEPIVLENLHPTEERIEARVPELVARCFITRRGAAEDALEEVPMRLETLVLLPNVRRMVSIFRGVCRVTESDAADVSCVVAALERRGAPRPVEHYRGIVVQRLDKQKGHLVGLRDRDLLPDPDPDAPKLPDEEFSDMEALLKREGVLEARGHARAQKELDGLRRSAHVLGVDPDASGIPREVPAPAKPPSNDDLLEYVQRVEDEAKKLEEDANVKHELALANARKNLEEHGIDLDEAIERSKKEGGGPPKYRADDHLRQMREIARIGRDMGAPMDELEAQIEDPAFEAKLRQLEETQITGYRLSAQHLPPAMIPGEEAQNELRSRVLSAIAEKKSMAGWDLTGADLRDLDLSGISLKEALLERADLRGARLAGTNLESAVLTRANLEGVSLSGANLKGANLGEIQAKDADFAGALLERAVLFRGQFEGAKLAGVDLRGGDILEADFRGANLEGIVADSVIFYEVNLEGAKLDRASLCKSTFFRCRLSKASLRGAVLEGTTLVEVNGAGAIFTEARATNLRLVSGCDLDGADFTGATLTGATLRKSTLTNALFLDVSGEGCDFGESNLQKARLNGSRLRGARFIRADVGGADFEKADLIESMFQSARLHGATFHNANLFRSTLLDAEGDTQTSFRGAHVERALFTRRRR